jgi:squalene-hopene/tetraprenyl-beta-curcumene cyclase
MRPAKSFSLALMFIAMLMGTVTLPAAALDDAHWHKAQRCIAKGITFLQTTQADDGSWTNQPGPAITALVVNAMIDQPEIDASNPYVARGLAYILSKCNEDGSIHGGILQNYNTSICLSALSRVNNMPEAATAIAKAQAYLTGMQWDNQPGPDGKPITKDHPFYGGSGYGKHGRPDMSNTQFMIQSLHDSGLNCNDPAFQRAMVFISRCQGIESNDLLKDKIIMDGGFIYATATDKEHMDNPETKAGTVEIDTKDAGQPVSRLRTYGSVTYAGFKSYLYANLKRDDPRVVAAYNWIRSNYTLDQNPGMPEKAKLQGLYYYYLAMARALNAWGSSTLITPDGKAHDWANDMIDKLASLQQENGSWSNEADRWMEGDPSLVTAYAIIVLNNATR